MPAAAARFDASVAMAFEMSEADTVAPFWASGIANEPTPQPRSQTVRPSASAQLSTLSMVCAWPSRISCCTPFTSSDSE